MENRNNTQHPVELFILRLISAIDRIMFAGAGGTGPWITPIAPASVFGWAFYDSMSEQMGPLAIAAGVAAAIGFIVAGSHSSHVAIRRPSFATWGLVAFYIALEIIGLLVMGVPVEVKAVGIVVSLLTLVVYVAHALDMRVKEEKEAEESDTDRARQLEAEEREFARQRQLEADRREYELEQQKLADKKELSQLRIDAKKEVQLSDAAAPSPPMLPLPPPPTNGTVAAVHADTDDDDGRWPEGDFKRVDLEQLRGIKPTKAKAVLRLAKESGVIESPSRGVYRVAINSETHTESEDAWTL